MENRLRFPIAETWSSRRPTAVCAIRLFLIRTFVGCLSVGVVIGVADFLLCRATSGACQVQRVTVRDAVGFMSAGVSGLLIRLPD